MNLKWNTPFQTAATYASLYIPVFPIPAVRDGFMGNPLSKCISMLMQQPVEDTEETLRQERGRQSE